MLIKSNERGKTHIDWLNSFHSFSFGNYRSDKHNNFSVLRVINEDYIKSQNGFGMHSHHNMEILSIVLSGDLTHTDSLGNKHVLSKKQVQLMSAGSGIRHSEFNYSEEEVHLLQIWIEPKEMNIAPNYQQEDVPDDDLVLVAGSENSIVSINQDCEVWLARKVDDLTLQTKFKNQWIQVISGTFDCDGVQLNKGDGLGVSVKELNLMGSGSCLIFDMI